MYYPYEFTSNSILKGEAFENMLTAIFKVLLEYRDKKEEKKRQMTYFCINFPEKYDGTNIYPKDIIS
jgi:hypothetical protein